MAANPREAVKYEAAKGVDIPAIKVLLDASFPIKYDSAFYASLDSANGAVLGVILVHSLVLSEEREAGRLQFQLVESQPAGGQAAYIMLLAVKSERQREGIGSDLVFHGVSKLTMDNPDIVACFCHALAKRNPAATGLYESLRFSRLGVVRGHYTVDGKPQDAAVWAQAINGHTLVEYSLPGGGGAEVDLADADQVLASRVSKVPKWQRDCFFQFVLPILVIGLLFLVCYALVVLGPLKGISGTHPPAAATGSHAGPGTGVTAGVAIELDPPDAAEL